MKPGDIAYLKSGGPAMTVKSVSDKEAECQWFDDRKVAMGGVFLLTSLMDAAGAEQTGRITPDDRRRVEEAARRGYNS